MLNYNTFNTFNKIQQDYFKNFKILNKNFAVIEVNNFNKQYILLFLAEFTNFANITFTKYNSKVIICLEFKNIDQIFLFLNLYMERIKFETFYFNIIGLKFGKNFISANLFKDFKLKKKNSLDDFYFFLFSYIILICANLEKMIMYSIFLYFYIKNCFILTLLNNVDFTSSRF